MIIKSIFDPIQDVKPFIHPFLDINLDYIPKKPFVPFCGRGRFSV